MYTVQDVFDLTRCPYPDLFIAGEPSWMPLERLTSFFEKQKLGKIEGTLEEGVHLVNPELISIGKGTVVESGAYIVGPCILGNECQIRHGAYLRGFVLAGDRVVIGHTTEVKHSILLYRSQAAHFAYVGNSILGEQVNLGAGTKCANLRLDHQSIRIEGIDTGMRKLGALCGDFSQTGCNSVLNPGTILLPHALVGPCKSVRGVCVARKDPRRLGV